MQYRPRRPYPIRREGRHVSIEGMEWMRWLESETEN